MDSDDDNVKSSEDDQQIKEENEMAEEDENEDVTSLIRIGPPGRNGRKSHPSTHIKQTTHQVEGSSKLPLPQKPLLAESGK